MDFPTDQVEELEQLFPGARRADEGGVTFFLLPGLRLSGRTPSEVEALLCPVQRDGYASRLFLAQQVQPCCAGSWGIVRILERNWHAVSWRTREGLRLAQMVLAHLDAFR